MIRALSALVFLLCSSVAFCDEFVSVSWTQENPIELHGWTIYASRNSTHYDEVGWIPFEGAEDVYNYDIPIDDVSDGYISIRITANDNYGRESIPSNEVVMDPIETDQDTGGGSTCFIDSLKQH